MSDSREVQPVVWSDREAILAFVRDRDVACPLCGYNLRDLPEPRCPECGRQLELRVGLVKPFLGGWISAFVGSAPGAGIGLAFILLSFKRGFPTHEGVQFLFFYFWAILMVPVSATLIIYRNRFLRLREMLQVQIAVVLILIELIMALIIFAILL